MNAPVNPLCPGKKGTQGHRGHTLIKELTTMIVNLKDGNIHITSQPIDTSCWVFAVYTHTYIFFTKSL